MKRTFAKVDKLKAGDAVRTDGGFTCLKAGIIRLVREDPEGGLYITCDQGKHYLAGQVGHKDDQGVWHDDRYVGLYPAGRKR